MTHLEETLLSALDILQMNIKKYLTACNVNEQDNNILMQLIKDATVISYTLGKNGFTL